MRMKGHNMTFRATHQITTKDETIPVLLVDGVAYTRDEWDADARADWEFTHDTGLLFQGQVIDGSSIQSIERKVARIFQEPTGKWYVCDDALPYLDARGYAYGSRREAVEGLRRNGEYTHYLTPNGKVVAL
jgi:hypothetical protein